MNESYKRALSSSFSRAREEAASSSASASWVRGSALRGGIAVPVRRRLVKSGRSRASARTGVMVLGLAAPSDRDGHREEEGDAEAAAEAEAARGVVLVLLLLLLLRGLAHSSAGWPETSALIPIRSTLLNQYKAAPAGRRLSWMDGWRGRRRRKNKGHAEKQRMDKDFFFFF